MDNRVQALTRETLTPPVRKALTDTFERLDEYLQKPLIQRALPLPEKNAILGIWQERHRF